MSVKIVNVTILVGSLWLTSCEQQKADTGADAGASAAQADPTANVAQAGEGGFTVTLSEGADAGQAVKAAVARQSATLSLRYEEELAIGEILIEAESLEGQAARARLTINFYGDPMEGEAEAYLNKTGTKANGWMAQLTVTPDKPSGDNWGYRADVKDMQLSFTKIGEWQEIDGVEMRKVEGVAKVAEWWEQKWGANRSSQLNKFVAGGEIAFAAWETLPPEE